MNLSETFIHMCVVTVYRRMRSEAFSKFDWQTPSPSTHTPLPQLRVRKTLFWGRRAQEGILRGDVLHSMKDKKSQSWRNSGHFWLGSKFFFLIEYGLLRNLIFISSNGITFLREFNLLQVSVSCLKATQNVSEDEDDSACQHWVLRGGWSW